MHQTMQMMQVISGSGGISVLESIDLYQLQAMICGSGTGAGSAGAGGDGGAAQPNPFAGMGGMGGIDPAIMQAMMGGGSEISTGSSADTRPPREKYADQLSQIKEMGFNDEDAILQILE